MPKRVENTIEGEACIVSQIISPKSKPSMLILDGFSFV